MENMFLKDIHEQTKNKYLSPQKQEVSTPKENRRNVERLKESYEDKEFGMEERV